MRLILIILLTFPLITISCIDKEFESELKFVQSIIDYPEKMDSIVTNSQFYDNSAINYETIDYKYLITVLHPDAKIITFRYTSIYHTNGSITDSVKNIRVKIDNGPYSIMSFDFKKLNGKVLLINIQTGN